MPPPKPNEELTTTQRKVLRAYRAHLDKHGAEPSLRVLGAAVGIEWSGVRYQLQRLQAMGYIAAKKVTRVQLSLSAKGRKAAT